MFTWMKDYVFKQKWSFVFGCQCDYDHKFQMDTGAICNEINVASGFFGLFFVFGFLAFFFFATCFITVTKHLMKIQVKRGFIWDF